MHFHDLFIARAIRLVKLCYFTYIQRMTREQLGVRLPVALLERLRVAADSNKNPYAPSMTQIVERGIELALRELGRKAKR